MNNCWNTSVKDGTEQEGPLMATSSGDDSKVSTEYIKIYFYFGVTRQYNLQLH